MIASRIKVMVFTALALVLSAGHSFCAELAAPVPAQSAAERTVADTHQAHESAAESSHHGAHGGDQGGDQNVLAAEHAPCGPDQSTCEHCEAAQFFKTTSVNFIASLNPPTTFISAPLSDIIVSSERIISSAMLAALQRHGPPGDTPVSLKTKLLN